MIMFLVTQNDIVGCTVLLTSSFFMMRTRRFWLCILWPKVTYIVACSVRVSPEPLILTNDNASVPHDLGDASPLGQHFLNLKLFNSDGML